MDGCDWRDIGAACGLVLAVVVALGLIVWTATILITAVLT